MAVWPLNSLIPLGEEENRAISPGGICWLNLVVLVERADRYSAAFRTPDFEGGRSGGSISRGEYLIM